MELNGINYTMTGENASDHDLMDGKRYTRVIQFLQPSVAYAHQFHVFGPAGWWHSPFVNLPVVTYVNTNTPTIENLTMDPTQGWINFTNMTIRLTYKDLDNDVPTNLSVVFNASGSLYTLYPFKETNTDIISYDGCTYKLDLRYTNTTFLYDATLKFYVFANDSTRTSRYPANPTQWLDGPNFIPAFNYSAGKLFNFEFTYLDTPITASTPASTNPSFVSINLPFDFNFYGLPFSSLLFSPNGFIRFTTNISTTLPVPGSTAPTSMLAINVLNNALSLSYYEVYYQVFSDKAVFLWYHPYPYSEFMIILHDDGRILFTYFTLNAGTPGGINLGNGMHYTRIPLSQVQLPLTNASFMFIPPSTNTVTRSSTINNDLFTTSQNVGITASYLSLEDIPIVQAYCFIEGKDFHGSALQTTTSTLVFQASGFINYATGAGFSLSRTLPSGDYNITIHLVDIYGTHFIPATHHIIVNNQPTITPVKTPGLYGGVGQNLAFTFSYFDDEGTAPAYFRIKWDGINYTFIPESLDYSKTVRFVWSVTLTHGPHTYFVYVKDQFQKEEIQKTSYPPIDVRWFPKIDIISFPPANLLIPGSFEVKVRITSNETGVSFGVKNVIFVGGVRNYTLYPVPGEGNTFSATIPFDWGTYKLYILVEDNYGNSVIYPAEGAVTVTVIDLPLILGIVIGCGAAIAILLFVQSRKKKAQAEQYTRLRRQVLAKKPTRRDIEETAEEKRKERQKEIKELEAVSTAQPAPVPIKKSAAAKRAATSTAGSAAATTAPTKVARPAPSSGTQPKDKSGYSQNAVETGTPVNRTVLKEYIERQRKEGARELHFIKIKNDLNIISQKKSSKLYRILQELVKDEILVRKGSNYIIVG